MDSELRGREILLCVTGGIACYKGVEVLRLLKKAGAEVTVAMTAHAQQFVAPLTFQTLSNRPVGTTLFDLDRESRIGHIRIAERAELALVAPCTANFAAKLRAGLADDLPSTVLLATDAPIVLALAMNDRMLASAATVENLRVLEERGVTLIAPEEGFLAEGKEAPGRLAEPEIIVARAAALLGTGKAGEPNGVSAATGQTLAGKRVLITAGPTREAIDPVRYVSNRSSGRMGYALAEACREAGARVVLVHGPVALPDPDGVEGVAVTTAAEMHTAVMARRADQDALILAAAVADFRPRETEPHKIKRAGKAGLTVEMVPSADIAAEVGAAKRNGQVLVAFAAESQDLVENATKKLKSKNADLIVANDITATDAGFDVAENRVTLIRQGADGNPADPEPLPLMDKKAVARHIVGVVAEMLGG